MKADQPSEPDSTVEKRRLLRAAAKRRRVRERLMTLGLVLGPVIFGVVYLLFLAAPQYRAETRFTVQATQVSSGSSSSGSSGNASLLSSGGGLGASLSGFVDGWAVQDFLNSRDCMLHLDQKIDLRRYLAKARLDPFNHLSSNANADDLFAAYRRVVHNSYNMIEQINLMRVDGFSPRDSMILSNALLAVTQAFVERMNQQGIDDAVKVSRDNVRMAQQQDQAALAALAAWRSQHGNVDPTADASMLLSQVGLVESSLSEAEVNLDKIKAMHNPDHPMLQPAQWQVDALTQRLGDLRARMSGQTGTNTSAALLRTYGQLTNEQTFADSNLLAARQNYQQAYTNAMALQRYLSIIATPVSATRPTGPNPLVFMVMAFAVGCGLAGAVNLVLSLYRSLRHA